MLREFYNRSKEAAERITNMIMNYTEVETKVREATSDEAWGTSGTLMLQIAEYTYTHSTFRDVMDMLYKRLHPANNCYWRRVYKSLVLLDFLLKNGSEHVLAGCREHIYDLRSLESFHYRDENGRDYGVNVRLKVQDVIKLIQDPEYLKQERAKSRSLRHLHGGRSCLSSNWDDSFGNRYYDDEDRAHRRYGDWQEGPPVRGGTYLDSNDSKLTPNPKLGSFEDWKIGRERGVVDDVVEQIKEAWDIAKLSTRSILNKSVHQPDPYETNPRMVSEEMFTFSKAEVDTGAISNGDDRQLPPPVNQQPTGGGAGNATRQLRRYAPAGISPQQQQQSSSSTATGTANAPIKPRPPSVELISPWDDDMAGGKPSGNAVSAQPHFWPGEIGRSSHDTNCSSAFTTSSQPVVKSRPADPLEDGEFGEFVSAGPLDPMQVLFPSPAAAGGSTVQHHSQAAGGGASDDLFAVFQTSGPAPATAHVWPSAAPSTSASSWLASNNINSQQSPVAPPGGSVHTGLSAGTHPPDTLSQRSSQQQPVVGGSGLWKDIDNLGINLDTIACPTRTSGRATAPSLRQLQQQQQAKPSSSSDPFSCPATAQVSPSSRLSS